MPACSRSHLRRNRLDAAHSRSSDCRPAALLLGALGLIMGMSSPGSAGELGVTVSNPTIASGGGAIVCADFALTYTIGEAAMGAVSAGEWRMVTGFPSTIPDPPPLQDRIFEDGFETAALSIAVATGTCAP